ncbi:MAG: hypothetical protein ACRC7O_05035 [Fimbriiglobus sp.]
MNRRLAAFFAACSLVFATAVPAFAQRGFVEIVDARVGLPPGRFVSERDDAQKAANIIKRNTWAPVYLRLEIKEPVPGSAKVVIDTADADDLRTSISYPLGNLSDRRPGEQVTAAELPFLPYVRSGDRGIAEVTVTVFTDDPNTRSRPLSEPKRIQFLRYREPATYVVLSLGSKLPGFDLPRPDGRKDIQPTTGALRDGRVEHAAIETVREMPDQWFGYAAADVVVLGTGAVKGEFLAELFSEQGGEPGKARRQALLEWVRRGGKLVVAVGANAGLLAQFPAFQEILPTKLTAAEPSRNVAELPLKWKVFGGQYNDAVLRPKADTFPVARLTADPARPPRYLLPIPDDAGKPDPELPLTVVQAPFGLGRVTLVAFDLDRSPFVDFPAKAEFWDWLLRTAGAERASVGTGNKLNEFSSYSDGKEDEFATEMRSHVDWFEGVPVISFGWVALFIALYTLLIGPVEYLFLKKVVGRLELTWITVPLIVLTVSAAAYFTAYAIKGNDLRINKVDLVDIDPASGRVYGRSWFTVFSPRIDSYTVGIEPREGWTVEKPGTPNPSTLVDWMAGGRSGTGNIVSRGYTYHTDPTDRRVADGLTGVPIQVWSTKAFTANWSGFTDPGAPPVESKLYHPPGDPTQLSGTLTCRLPVAAEKLQDAVLIYAGRSYKLPGLAAGQDTTPVLDQTRAQDDWFTTAAQLEGFGQSNNNVGRWGSNAPAPRKNVSLWGALFHERSLPRDSRSLMNASFRDLDQSWRVGNRPEDLFRDQAILLVRVPTENGLAEPIMTAADGPAVTKLWLNALPGGPEKREPVKGMLRQETYIRAFLPVAPTPPAAQK